MPSPLPFLPVALEEAQASHQISWQKISFPPEYSGESNQRATLRARKMGAAKRQRPPKDTNLLLLRDVQNNDTGFRSSSRNAGSCHVNAIRADVFALLGVGN